ncbi:hypothetical protein HPG69_007651, partial [Diceros bicornis minor]
PDPDVEVLSDKPHAAPAAGDVNKGSAGSLTSGKEMQDERPSDIQSRSSSPWFLPAVGPANRESPCHLCCPCHCHCDCCGAKETRYTVPNCPPPAVPDDSLRPSPVLGIPLNENGGPFHSHLYLLLPAGLQIKRTPDTHVCRFSPFFSLTHPSSSSFHLEPCVHQPPIPSVESLPPSEPQHLQV